MELLKQENIKQKHMKTDLLELCCHHQPLHYVSPVISSVVKGISRRGVKRAGRGYIGKKF